jgi:hypothetical protein
VKSPSKQAPLPQSEVYQELEAYARGILVRTMKRQQVTYADLSTRLTSLGIRETPDTLNRKVNRQRFQASFLLACLKALEVDALDIRNLDVSPVGRTTRLAREQLEEDRRVFRRREPKSQKPKS